MNEAVRRVLRAKFKLGLFENPYVDPKVAKASNGKEAHGQLAKKAAQESVVLLNIVCHHEFFIGKRPVHGRNYDLANLKGEVFEYC